MTNKQRAAARRAANQFPGVGIRTDGNVLTPYRLDSPQTEGSPVTVTDMMREGQITFELAAACESIA